MSCRTQKAFNMAAAAAKAAAIILRAAAPAAAALEVAEAAVTRMKPRVAITAGDPAGIGPEVAALAAADPRVLAACEPVIYSAPSGTEYVPGVLSAEAGRAA